jgi:DNA primase
MSQLDYRAIRNQIEMRRVLDLLRFQETTRTGHQLRGRCVLASHDAHAERHRCFNVHLERHLYYCFLCRRGGNQLDLWAAITHLPLKPATLDLCQRLGIDPVTLPPRNRKTALD